MRFFSREANGEVVLSREELELIPQIKAMLRLDYNKAPKDKDGRLRLRAKRELTYVYYMYDHSSLFSEMNDKDKHFYSSSSAELPIDFEISSELQAFIDWFIKYQDEASFSLLLLNKARKAAYKLADYFDNVDFTEKDEQNRPIYNIKQFIDTLKQLGDVIEGLTTLENNVKNELSSEGKLVGNSLKGIEED